MLCELGLPAALCPDNSPQSPQSSPRLGEWRSRCVSPAGPGPPGEGEKCGGSQSWSHLSGGRGEHPGVRQPGRVSQALEPRPGGGGGASEGPAGSPVSSQSPVIILS